jgi:uncharacterized membrane protein YfcA
MKRDGTPRGRRLLLFLSGAAVGSVVGVVLGAILSAPLGQAIAPVVHWLLERLFGRRDEELRFELLLQ